LIALVVAVLVVAGFLSLLQGLYLFFTAGLAPLYPAKAKPVEVELTIGRFEAWSIGLYAEEVKLKAREGRVEVWSRDDGDEELTFQGVLTCTVDEFWDECREGMSK
jgi:hypothetical protein